MSGLQFTHTLRKRQIPSAKSSYNYPFHVGHTRATKGSKWQSDECASFAWPAKATTVLGTQAWKQLMHPCQKQTCYKCCTRRKLQGTVPAIPWKQGMCIAASSLAEAAKHPSCTSTLAATTTKTATNNCWLVYWWYGPKQVNNK